LLPGNFYSFEAVDLQQQSQFQMNENFKNNSALKGLKTKHEMVCVVNYKTFKKLVN